jgi:hypothetical protein
MHLTRKLAAIVPVAALALIGPAMAANASTHGTRPLFHPATRPATIGGGTQYAMQAAGYNAIGTAAGTNFKTITETATLQDPSQFASVTDGLGFGPTLSSGSGAGSAEVDLGISDSTTTGTQYDPAVDFYLGGQLQTGAPEYNALWCPDGTNCVPADNGGGFNPGDKVTETLSFNPADGVLDYAVYDSQDNLFTGQFTGLKGQDFSHADLGGGFGSFTAPATAEQFVTFSSVHLTTYSGKNLTLASAGVTASPQVATSDGTSTGTVQAKPTVLNKTHGFSLRFEPAAAG